MSANAHTIADDQVRSAFQRWKNLEEEKARVGDDLKELFAEQKAFGHDTKAMRAAFRLKVKMDEADPADAEHEALVDTYLAALEAPRASRAYARENIEKNDRKARAALRTSEAMDDNKAFSAELVAAGLISEEAHAENIALSNAVARKYGAGVIDPETGEILDEPRRSDLGLNIQTKHEDIRTAPVTAEEHPHHLKTTRGDESGTLEGSVEDHGQVAGCKPESQTDGNETVTVVGDESGTVDNLEMDRAMEGSFETGSEAAEKGREAIPAGPDGADLNHAGAGESPATDQPLAGGDHEVASIAERERETVTSNTGEGAANPLSPQNPSFGRIASSLHSAGAEREIIATPAVRRWSGRTRHE